MLMLMLTVEWYTYVTPPMATQVIIAMGASLVGRGISSVI
jgi:hypothetical protein